MVSSVSSQLGKDMLTVPKGPTSSHDFLNNVFYILFGLNLINK